MPTQPTGFAPIEDLIDDVRAGRIVILTDDEHRENEGDLIVAAEKITPEIVNFFVRQGGGMMCLCLTGEQCDKLALHPQSIENNTPYATAYMVTIDAAERFGVTTGVSASDRATTILRCIDDTAQPTDLRRPGHIAPLRARDGGVLVRAGHTEATVDLARLAGLKPAGVLIEVLNPDGSVARLPELQQFAAEHNIKIGSIADLIEYRIKRERQIERLIDIDLPTRWGTFRCIAYRSNVDRDPHLALVLGDVGQQNAAGDCVEVDRPVLVRVHSECLTGDVFGSLRCDCGGQLDAAMQRIADEGEGVLVYLRQEGRGIGLLNKLKAYQLQDNGYDTVDANLALGLPADKRDYGIGAQILRDLGLCELRILTNNPKKTNRLEVYGLKVTEQLPIQMASTPENKRYLDTKRDRMGHTLSGAEGDSEAKENTRVHQNGDTGKG